MSEQRTAYQLVEAVVTRLDPDELPYLPQLWGVYVRHPDDLERAGERLLGSGVLADVAAWAPVVVSFVGGAVLEAAKQEISDRSRGGVRAAITWTRRRRARRAALEAPLPAFDDAQRHRIGESVLSRARALGMPEERAQLLADAVVGELQRSADAPRPGA
ncbi:hypothetical protein [Nonomuraea sp. NPDC048916]|uniref:hypothetical protein n=1 Tax=Nonomuraea sp. NPDC048916 TaxID=3154232 RepID=UPI0033D93B29